MLATCIASWYFFLASSIRPSFRFTFPAHFNSSSVLFRSWTATSIVLNQQWCSSTQLYNIINTSFSRVSCKPQWMNSTVYNTWSQIVQGNNVCWWILFLIEMWLKLLCFLITLKSTPEINQYCALRFKDNSENEKIICPSVGKQELIKKLKKQNLRSMCTLPVFKAAFVKHMNAGPPSSTICSGCLPSRFGIEALQQLSTSSWRICNPRPLSQLWCRIRKWMTVSPYWLGASSFSLSSNLYFWSTAANSLVLPEKDFKMLFTHFGGTFYDFPMYYNWQLDSLRFLCEITWALIGQNCIICFIISRVIVQF